MSAPGSAAWWREHEERLRRRRPHTDGLTLELVLAEALALVDAEGMDALTVRALAGRLGTGSSTLYRHVASRDELLVLLVDAVLGELRLPDPRLPGRVRVEQLSAELRRVLRGHPHVVPALGGAPLLGPNAMRASACGLENLLAAGHPPDRARAAYLALLDYVLGSVAFDAAAGSRGDGGPSSDEVFAFGLRTFLDGLGEGLSDASSAR
ncbi:helix-turn-helix domain-containing protein [Blastococcus sp. CCUG 61487]|uniref:TetR/AcrR family transcriptional regulator n=1 Tax=Blastococcus sp. CCUG 61487 TaxID=1840703 RepID=UPI0010BF845C|nr:helix-turn-helix domain-containing protein [Blastococcus sp. CCUG 61487]